MNDPIPKSIRITLTESSGLSKKRKERKGRGGREKGKIINKIRGSLDGETWKHGGS